MIFTMALPLSKNKKEIVVKKLLERGKDVKIIVIINNNQIYDSVIFSENNT